MVNSYRNLNTRFNFLGSFFFLVNFLRPIDNAFPKSSDADITFSEPQNSIRVHRTLDLYSLIESLPEFIFFRSILSKNIHTPNLDLGQISFLEDSQTFSSKNITSEITYIGRINIPFYLKKPHSIPQPTKPFRSSCRKVFYSILE